LNQPAKEEVKEKEKEKARVNAKGGNAAFSNALGFFKAQKTEEKKNHLETTFPKE
jgi:hypothetical protein